jgi:eukaryotic-like serine/threonine-protein kinase
VETPAGIVYRFGPFEVDTAAGELLKQGKRISLQEQPFRLLVVLLESPGEVVTRAEIQRRIWEDHTFVDFDSGLRVAVGKLRTALGDDAGNPRYIETIPKRGYRFLGPPTLGPTAQSTNSIGPINVAEMNPSVAIVAAKSWQGRKWAVVVGLLLGSAAAGAFLFFFHGKRVLTERDTVVLADFANSTGDPLFDDTLREGMTVQLEQSPFLSLVSDERIQKTLALMGQAPGAGLTPALARDVCERTGSAAVLDGSIASLGSQYVLGLRAVNCRTGEVFAEEQAQAARKEDVLNALSRIAGKFRVRVGESLRTVEKHDAPLDEATTPSLDALKAYSAGLKVLEFNGSAAAMPFFMRAIEIDPKFAMAYALLGRVYGDIGETVLSTESSTKAYQLRDRASDAEKFFITASYDTQVTGNLERAEQTCASWVQAYPRALMPHGFLSGMIPLPLGHYERSIDEANIALGLDPDFAFGYENLALSYLALEHIDEAENALRQASERKLEIPDFFVQRYTLAFLKGDDVGMKRDAAEARGKPVVEDWMSNSQGFALAYSGHLGEARKMSSRAADLARQTGRRETEALYETDAAMREALFGNASIARQRAKVALALSNSRDVEYGVAFALAVAGESSRSQSLTDDLSRRFPEDTKVSFTFTPSLRALLALNRNEPSKAVELLQTAIPYESGIQSSGGSEFLLGAGNLYPAFVRGEAYLALHQGAEAAVEFKKILDHRGIVLSDPIGALAHLQLGRAYVLAGDKIKARAAYKDFLTLWKDADPDIPILKEATAEYTKLQ